MERIDLEGLDHLADALREKQGVLLTPNHSFHWDSHCLLEAAERLATPFYIMTAWQVFAMSGWFERTSMQRCGCFSVDREGSDLQAAKTSVEILQERPHPLVVFPEGDVYHTNDRITPFRDGAAAMALIAARKSARPIVVIPVAIKRWYQADPTPSLLRTVESLERELYWRPRRQELLVDRILGVAGGLLALKEIEYLRVAQTGELAERTRNLAEFILGSAEQRHGITARAAPLPERVKEVRRRVIQQRQEARSNGTPNKPGQLPRIEQQRAWQADMDDMFLVTQLYSYPGDYLRADPTWERMAETLDKLEEDALEAAYPTVHGSRRVVVRFDAPIAVPCGKERRWTAGELTTLLQTRVQTMLDELNRVARRSAS